jgi:hypothetical protein
VVTSKEATPISGNFTFQVSYGSRFAINDLHTAYLLLEVERTFIYTRSADDAIANDINVFFGDKNSDNFIKQFKICCNNITITENLDFVFETNILVASIADLVTARKPETLTPDGEIDVFGSSICGKYINKRTILYGSPVVVKYNINIPMKTFYLFDKLRYLPKFFGNLKLDIVPTFYNMIMKVIDNIGINTNTCSNVNKEMAYQCFGVGIPCYYPVATGQDPSATWIMLTP